MKRYLLVLLCAMALVSACKQNPEQEKLSALATSVEDNLYNNIIPFWVDNVVDNTNGGFYGVVDQKGIAKESAPKGAIVNARILWTFSTIYIKDKDDVSLMMAKRAYDYMKTYFLDKEYGGVYYTLDNTGNVISDQKDVYANAFAIYGFSEYARATGDAEALNIAIELFTKLDEYAYDTLNGGYNESFMRNWSPIKKRMPGAAQTTEALEDSVAQNKTMNTSLHVMEALANLYRVWKDPTLEKRLHEMIEIFLDKIINAETHHQNYMLTPDWENASAIKSYGHDIECSWLLLESAEILGNTELIEKCKVASLAVAEAAMEGLLPNGRMIYDVYGDETPSPSLQWWAQAEAIVGCVNAWQLSSDAVWLDRATKIWEFTDSTFVDKEYGEWYYGIDRNDNLRVAANKVDAWKCPYHNSRMCLEIIRRAKLNQE